jgi:hypothetical protein
MAKAAAEANAQHPTLNVQHSIQKTLALDVGRSALGVCFNVIPDRIHLGQFHFAQFPAARFEFVLQSIEARNELISGRLERGFCVDFALPRQIYDGEQQIANLVFDHFLLS